MNTMKTPAVSRMAKIFIASVVLMPLALAALIAMNPLSNEIMGRYSDWGVIVGLVLFSVALAPGAVRIASVYFSADGVGQFSLYSNGNWCVTREIKWKDVDRVMYKQLAYTIYSEDASVLISLICFNKYRGAAEFINFNLPKGVEWLDA